MKEETQGIVSSKVENFFDWYSEVVVKSGFAEPSAVSGCPVIKPLGFSVWKNIESFFDSLIFSRGVRNAYFPLFIPERFFKLEASHAEGFSPEVAWIENKDPKAGRVALRPTSETIVHDSFSRWVRSWRDLPLKINQWCNVVRWEIKDVRIFLRGREFFWQEGHCAYESEKECEEEAKGYLDDYVKVLQDLLAVPVVAGVKTKKETFAGAKRSFSIESFMPDGKALQSGTSHNLGDGFAKSFGIKFQDKSGGESFVFQNSWGLSTRVLGAMIMTHSDDKGLVLPPRVAFSKAVIVPIFNKDNRDVVFGFCERVKDELKEFNVDLDYDDEHSPGWKFSNAELRGYPFRIEVGGKEVDKDCVVFVSRDSFEKSEVKFGDVKNFLSKGLDEMHDRLFVKAKKFLDGSVVNVSCWDDFLEADKGKKLILCYFCGEPGCEDKIKEETKGVTSRCVGFGMEKDVGSCVKCSKEGPLTYFSRAY